MTDRPARRVLVTGASGFIGRHTLAPLLDRGYEVHAVARRPPETSGVEWHAADLFEGAGVDRVLDDARPTHLLHLAWCVEPQLWTNPENLDWVAATLRMVRAFTSQGGARAVLAGTHAEYDWSQGVCSELVTPLRPRMLYGTAKDAVRRIVEAFAPLAGLSAAWARIFHVYGPHDHRNKLIPYTVLALLRGDPALLSEGHQEHDFVHVADVGSALAAVVDSDVTGPVNIGSGEGHAVREVATRIGQLLGRPDLLRFGALETSHAGSHSAKADVRRLAEEVGWTHSRTFEEGLTETVEWWRAVGETSATGPGLG